MGFFIANILAHVARQDVAMSDNIELPYLPIGVVRLQILLIQKPSHLNYDMWLILTNDGSRGVSTAVTCARGVSPKDVNNIRVNGLRLVQSVVELKQER